MKVINYLENECDPDTMAHSLNSKGWYQRATVTWPGWASSFFDYFKKCFYLFNSFYLLSHLFFFLKVDYSMFFFYFYNLTDPEIKKKTIYKYIYNNLGVGKRDDPFQENNLFAVHIIWLSNELFKKKWQKSEKIFKLRYTVLKF